MKSVYKPSLWRHPAEHTENIMDNVSCVLFHGSDSVGTVLASTARDARIAVGTPFGQCLSLSKEDMACLQEARERRIPVWIRTPMGVGIIGTHLFGRTGACLYLHMHDDPDRLCRLINRGTVGAHIPAAPSVRASAVSIRLGQKDVEACHRMNAILNTLSDMKSRSPQILRGRSSLLHSRELYALLIRTSVLSDCRLNMDASEVERVGVFPCYAPDLLEGLLLYWMTLLRSLSVDHIVTCHMDHVDGREGYPLYLTLGATIAAESPAYGRLPTGKLIYGMDHMIRAGDMGGVVTVVNADEPYLPADASGVQRELKVHLWFLEDPTADPPEGLKAMGKRFLRKSSINFS